MKKCIICGEEKEFDQFYDHPQMKDGKLNKCKECSKIQEKKRQKIKRLDTSWVELERSRGREKYHRLCYVKKCPTKEKRKEGREKYFLKYPEKLYAKTMSFHVKSVPGKHKHHWSYNREHIKDVIFLNKEDHNTVHRFMVYDPERYMYRKRDGTLIDNRDDAICFYNEILKKEMF